MKMVSIGPFLIGALVATTVGCSGGKKDKSSESDDPTDAGEASDGASLTVFMPEQKPGATAEATDLDEVTFDRVEIEVTSFNPPCDPISDDPLVCKDATAAEIRTIDIVAGATPEPLKFSGLKSYLNVDYRIFSKGRFIDGGGTGNDLLPGGETYVGFAYQPVGVLGLYLASADGKVEAEAENSVDDICQDNLDSAYDTKTGDPAFLCKLEVDGKLVKSERAPLVSIAKQAVKVGYCYDVKTPMTHAAFEAALTCTEDGVF